MSKSADWVANQMPVAEIAIPHVALPVTIGKLANFPRDAVGCMKQLHAEHGPIAALREGDQQIVFIFDPEFNHEVLSQPQLYHSRFFALRGPRNSSQRRLTSGLLSMNEDQHRRHRRMIMGPFQKRSFDGYHDRIIQLAEEMLSTWQVGQVRNLHEDMAHFMLRVTSSMLFGFDVADLAFEIGDMLDEWVTMNHELGMGALVSQDDFTGGYDRLLSFAQELEARIRRMIDLRRQSSKQGDDVLSILLRSHDEQGGLSDEELVGHTALLFGAAHMTTAHSLSWTLFLLAQHPAEMQRLAAEFSRELGGAVPRIEQLGQLDVLDSVIKESMRVLPASGYSQRINHLPTRLGPFDLPRGTTIIFSQFITHHRADLFPNPEHFQPARWETISPSPYAYLPFAAGPRMCLGGPLAMQILKTVLPMILQRFRLQVQENAEINGQIIATMLGPTSPIPMELHAPDGQFRRTSVQGNIHNLVCLQDA